MQCGYIHILVGLALVLLLTTSAPASDHKLFTEQLPPFNYVENGVLTGPGADIVLAVFERAGIPLQRKEISVLPWARAYNITMEQPNTMLFSTGRTPERENDFKWIGPILHITIGAIIRKELITHHKKIDETTNLRIGTVYKTVAEHILGKKGVPKERVTAVSTPEAAVKMLAAGRIDILAFNIHTSFYLMGQLGIDPSSFQVLQDLERIDLYIACNRGTNDETISRLQQSLAKLRCNGGKTGSSALAKLVAPYGDYFPAGSFPEELPCSSNSQQKE